MKTYDEKDFAGPSPTSSLFGVGSGGGGGGSSSVMIIKETRTPSVVARSALIPGEDGYITPSVENLDNLIDPDNLIERCRSISVPISQYVDLVRRSRDHGNGNINIEKRKVILAKGNAANNLADNTARSGDHERDASGGGGSSGTTQKYMGTASKKLPWRYRFKHVTWAWFTMNMATGGIANVLATVPYHPTGLHTIGVIIFLFNIVLYIIIWGLILTRFILFPYTFRASLSHPTESLFVPAFAVSFGTILINIVEYGFGQVGEWLNRTVLIMFWIDAGLAFILSITIYLILWSTQSFTIARMTPIWIFPAYPMLIIGPHAAQLSARLTDPNEALEVIVGGFTIQGVGFLVSLTIYSAFVYRLMTQKLPADSLRPGMFVSVGPSAFTVSGTIGMAANLERTIARLPGGTFMDVPNVLAAQILKLTANWMSLWLWGLAFWFFFISLFSNIVCFRSNHHVSFAMTWFSFVFPQTALTNATFRVAQAFNIKALSIVGCVMTCLLVLVWLFVMLMMARAIVQKQILWPEKGEDKSEGGFVMRKERAEQLVLPGSEWNEKGPQGP